MTTSATPLSIPLQRFTPQALIPTKQRGDAGYDLYSVEALVIPVNGRRLVRTGIGLRLPEGYYGRIAPRSGLALKAGLDVFGGVVDGTFSGDIGVILFNSGDKPHVIQFKDRIAQLIIERYHDVGFAEVGELPKSERGAGGFGSTGA